MSDNVVITAGSGTTVAADEVSDGTLGSCKVQYVKLMDGTIDGTTKATVNSTGLKVDASGAAVPVTDNSGSLTVDNAGTFAVQAASTQSGNWTVSLTDISQAEYEAVAASQTTQTLGATGGTGDYLAGVLCTPTTLSAGSIVIVDGTTSMSVFTGGASSVTNLVPFLIPLGIKSVNGAWKVSTGAGISAIGIGNFT